MRDEVPTTVFFKGKAKEIKQQTDYLIAMYGKLATLEDVLLEMRYSKNNLY